MSRGAQNRQFCKGAKTSQVLITGATGLVGGHLLRMSINESKANAIAASTRCPLGDMPGMFNPHDPQLSDALTQVIDPIDIVFCCLGITQQEAGSKEAFIHVDYTLVVDTTLTGRRPGAQHMLVVSATGANTHSPFFYDRVKGEMGEALIAQNWPKLTIARPSMLLDDRSKQRMSEALFAPLFRLLSGNWKSIDARDVAQVILAESMWPEHEGVTTLSSSELRERAEQLFPGADSECNIHALNYHNLSLGNAVTGQSSSQTIISIQWWKPTFFFLVVIAGPWYVKWGPYYGKAFTAAETHSIGRSIPAQADASPWQAALDYAMIYSLAVWKAAVLRVIPGSLIQVLIPRNWLLRTPGQSRFRGTLLGILLSLPGMMCTCCAASVAAGMRRQQVSIGGALTFWMGNSVLNPVTLVLMGFVLGWGFAVIRLVAGLVMVLLVATLAQKWVRETSRTQASVEIDILEAQGGFSSRWGRALWTLSWSTIPVYILVVLVLDAARAWLFSYVDGAVDNSLMWAVAMAVTGCSFVIPTVAEIPIVQTMMLVGMGTAPALASLMALPAVSLPSLIMLCKVFPMKALWLIRATVAVSGVIVGGLVLLF